MIRYLRLYGYFVRFSFSKAMEFRFDFFFKIIMDCIYYVVNMAFYSVIYRHTQLIGGWNLEQIYVFAGGYFVIDALMMTILSNNLWWLPSYINKGEIDFYLVRPVSSLFFLSVRDFAANSFMNLVIAIAIWAWAIFHYSGAWTLGQLMVYILLIFNGVFLYYIMQVFSVIPVFWTQSTQGLFEMMFTLNTFMERPHRIFTGWTRKILVSILPYCLMASYPAQIFFEGVSIETLLHIALVTSCLFIAMVALWAKGLKNYASASS